MVSIPLESGRLSGPELLPERTCNCAVSHFGTQRERPTLTGKLESGATSWRISPGFFPLWRKFTPKHCFNVTQKLRGVATGLRRLAWGQRLPRRRSEDVGGRVGRWRALQLHGQRLQNGGDEIQKELECRGLPFGSQLAMRPRGVFPVLSSQSVSPSSIWVYLKVHPKALNPSQMKADEEELQAAE